jgi:hypothetical protein
MLRFIALGCGTEQLLYNIFLGMPSGCHHTILANTLGVYTSHSTASSVPGFKELPIFPQLALEPVKLCLGRLFHEFTERAVQMV